MNKIVVWFFTFGFSIVFFAADQIDNSQRSLISSKVEPSTAELRRLREKQRKDDSIKIGTIASVFTAIDQLCTYENPSYRKVSFQDVAREYPEILDTIKTQALQGSSVSYSLSHAMYEVIRSKMERGQEFRSITVGDKNYFVVGDNPVASDYDEQIYDITKARKFAIRSIEREIDRNPVAMQRKCIGRGMARSEVPSDVISVACCSFLMHRKCLNDCKINGIRSCLDPLCRSGVAWNDQFYQTHAVKAPEIISHKDCEKTCSLCLENFVPQHTSKKKFDGLSSGAVGQESKKCRHLDIVTVYK